MQRGVPNIGAPAPAIARGNTSADAKKAAKAQVPTAYVLPKCKKDFATGRPIVSFAQAQGRVLWESFADVLSLMVRQACPDSFGEGSGVNQLHLIKQHFRSLSETTRQEHTTREDITRMNQDLAGFFSKHRLTPHLIPYTPPYTFTSFLKPPNTSTFKSRKTQSTSQQPMQ